MKKLFALLLAVMLCTALSATVFADMGLQETTNAIYGPGWYPYPYPGYPQYPDTATALCPLCGTRCLQFKIPQKGTFVYCPKDGLVLIEATTPADPDAKERTVTVRSTVGGTVAVNGSTPKDGSVSIKSTDNCLLTIQAEYGFECVGVYLNGYYLGVFETMDLGKLPYNITVYAVFRAVDTRTIHDVRVQVSGAGNVYGVVNGRQVGTVQSLGITYADKATLRFTPAKGHYALKNVAINGVNMGAISTYDISRLTKDLTIDVTYIWKCPFTDVDSAHMQSVEYVVEADIMGSPNAHLNTDLFMGTSNVSVRSLAIYLAELSDVDNQLNTVKERLAWAKKFGLFDEEENVNTTATVQRTCDMLAVYLRALEKDRGITFSALQDISSAYDIAAKMELVTELSYKANGNLTRYGMADICYAVAQLEVK